MPNHDLSQHLQLLLIFLFIWILLYFQHTAVIRNNHTSEVYATALPFVLLIQWILVNRDSYLCGENPEEQKLIDNLLHFYGTSCRYIGPAAAIWRTCDYYVVDDSPRYTWSQSCCDSVLWVYCMACAAIFSFKNLDPHRNVWEIYNTLWQNYLISTN
jgi:hypothetical protein